MEPTNGLDRKGQPAATGRPPPSDSGVLDDAKSLWDEVRGLAHDQLALAALETRLAYAQADATPMSRDPYSASAASYSGALYRA